MGSCRGSTRGRIDGSSLGKMLPRRVDLKKMRRIMQIQPWMKTKERDKNETGISRVVLLSHDGGFGL